MKKSAPSLSASLLLIGAGYLLASLTRKRKKENEQEEQGPHEQPSMPFNKDAGDPIDDKDASRLTKAFRDRYKRNTTFANYCGRRAIEEILKNPDCAGLRVYRAIKGKDKHGIIVVGVTNKGKDITETQELVQEYALAESYDKCLDDCDINSTLYGRVM